MMSNLVHTWQLKPKDKLNWRWEVIQGKMVAVVERYEGERKQRDKEIILWRSLALAVLKILDSVERRH